VIAVPVLPRRLDESGEPVEELKRREVDDTIGPRPRGLPPATPPDPVGRLVSQEHVADPRLGGISFLHRFGSALNHHVPLLEIGPVAVSLTKGWLPSSTS
jgi:hypothetical protein